MKGIFFICYADGGVRLLATIKVAIFNSQSLKI